MDFFNLLYFLLYRFHSFLPNFLSIFLIHQLLRVIFQSSLYTLFTRKHLSICILNNSSPNKLFHNKSCSLCFANLYNSFSHCLVSNLVFNTSTTSPSTNSSLIYCRSVALVEIIINPGLNRSCINFWGLTCMVQFGSVLNRMPFLTQPSLFIR